MKQQLFKFLFIIGLVSLQLPAAAQRFDSVLTLLDSKYPQEKLHLHFDRGVYSPGETIWFKAYLFTGVFPSPMSKTLYAELLDDQGKLLDRRSAPMLQYGAAAAFDLPADLKAQTVYVRAYTRWMLNFDTAFLYVKAFPITNKAVKQPAAAVQTPAAFLQFFPEGGNLVTGIQSKVAFKATDNKGLPIAVKGEIVDNTGKKLGGFASVHDGMGYFMLLPEQGLQYKAVWKDQFGKPQETALPTSLSQGVVLKMDHLGDKVNFAVQKSPGSPVQVVHVVAQHQQQLIYRAKASLSTRNDISGSIPLKDVPAGIVQVTVFDQNEMPLAERLVFANNDDYYFITDLNAPLKGFAKRAKNVIQIDVPDTIACNLSISITDASLDPARKNEDDIFSHLLLTSDIKGYVHQPAYYFSGSEQSAAHLDLVMLTNGWRRFRWEDALAGRFPQLKNLPEGYLAIEGKVSGINRSSLVNKELTGVMESKVGRQFVSIPVTPDGNFRLDDMVFYDTLKLYYQFNNDKDKILTSRGVFSFRNSLYNEALRSKPEAVLAYRPDSILAVKNATISARRQEQDDANRKVQTLAAVEVTAKQKTKEQKAEEQYVSGMFSGGNGNTFLIGDDPVAQSSMNVFNYLTGRVAGLRVSQAGGVVSLNWRGGAPAVFLDEMMVDAATVQNIPMTDVAMIKVFNPPFLGAAGGGGANGAIAVYTKRGSGATQDIKGLDAATITGYSTVKEFYSPDYSKYEDATTDTDYRKTLYWEPFVLTNKQNRRILLTFYNNDITNRIRVVVEGINLEGKLTRMEKIFE
jgi:hypothetical protein